jgi:hypothetical protein
MLQNQGEKDLEEVILNAVSILFFSLLLLPLPSLLLIIIIIRQYWELNLGLQACWQIFYQLSHTPKKVTNIGKCFGEVKKVDHCIKKWVRP